MKKFLLSIACALVSVMGMAQTKTYTDKLYVTINDAVSGPFNANVLVTDNLNGTINFALKNFMLTTEDGDVMPVGNISVENLPLTVAEKGPNSFGFNGIINIVDGDDPNYDEWLGPMLGDVPVVLRGKLTDNKLYVSIDIDMQEALGQTIYVKFGDDDFNSVAYVDDLYVTINDAVSGPFKASVIVSDNGNETINFALKNFMLTTEDGDVMPVGNISVENLPLAVAAKGPSTFSFNGVINIADGDDPNYDEWLGPMLGDVPLVLTGKMTDDKLYVSIDIDMQEALGQTIYVKFGTDDFVVPPTIYTVTFIVEDKVTTVEVEEGASVTAPEVEEREGYTFAWGEIPAAITEDVTIKGTYTVNTYTVTYTIDGEVAGTATVAYGEKVPAGEYTEREGYTFAWGEAPETMPAHDVTVAGTYTANHYTVTYKVGDEVIATYDVVYGEAMPAAPEYTPESDDRYTRTLAGWDGESCETVPAHDVVYTAIINVVDAINAVSADETGVIYDINGRRVSNVQRGVYIVNGKKFIK